MSGIRSWDGERMGLCELGPAWCGRLKRELNRIGYSVCCRFSSPSQRRRARLSDQGDAVGCSDALVYLRGKTRETLSSERHRPQTCSANAHKTRNIYNIRLSIALRVPAMSTTRRSAPRPPVAGDRCGEPGRNIRTQVDGKTVNLESTPCGMSLRRTRGAR
jgi:hypothetical protein